MILVVVAHPDDETLGCGGLIASVEESVAVFAVCNPRKDRQRYYDLGAAADVLGVSYTNNGQCTDQRLDTYPLCQIARLVEELVVTYEPETVYTHWSGDLNRDHRIVSEAVSVACRPYASSVKRLLHFEVPSSTEWGLTGFKPNTFVDISDTIETKIKAMQCYETEVREPPHPRSPDSMRARAKYWGQQVGMEYAEPFVLIRDCR